MKLASLCYVSCDGKTLMLQRNKKADDIHHGKWNGLGGKFEPGETPEECVTREVSEESGLQIQFPRLCGLLTFPRFKDDEDWYVFVYTAEQFSGELIESSEGTLAWIDSDKLLALPLWEGDRHFLPCIEQGRFFSGKFTYREMRLVEWSMDFPRG